MIGSGNLLSKLVSTIASGMLAAGAVLCLLCIDFAASAQEARTITFDAPGADLNAGDYNGTFANGINARGVTTGYYIDANNVYHGFLRTPDGKFTTFEAPGADTTPGSYNGTSPNSINDLGVVTGEYWDASGFGHGFVRTPGGEVTSFDVPGAGGYGSTPLAINIEGAIVGYYSDSNFAFHSFQRRPDGAFDTWSGPGQCTGNGSVGCYGSGAFDINSFGIIAAGYNDTNLIHHGLIRSRGGKLTQYDVPGAYSTGCPGCGGSGLNQWGAIAGTWADANFVNHGYLRSPDGTFATFDAPGAGTGAYAGTGCSADCPVSLNNRGAVTGMYIDANYVLHGYLRSPDGRIKNIDPSGSQYTWSSDVNDVGAITGYYVDGNGVVHGFLRVPD